MQGFSGDRMRELDFCGMQHKPAVMCCFLSVEPVSHDGCIQSQRMSRVNTQLVGATCLRIEIYKPVSVVQLLAQHVSCDGGFAVFPIYHLPWSVVRIGQQGQGNQSFRN